MSDLQNQIEQDDLKINNLYKVFENGYADEIEIKYLFIDDLIQKNSIDPNCFKNINCLEDLKD